VQTRRLLPATAPREEICESAVTIFAALGKISAPSGKISALSVMKHRFPLRKKSPATLNCVGSAKIFSPATLNCVPSAKKLCGLSENSLATNENSLSDEKIPR
jgi:hypothetical protein